MGLGAGASLGTWHLAQRWYAWHCRPAASPVESAGWHPRLLIPAADPFISCRAPERRLTGAGAHEVVSPRSLTIFTCLPFGLSERDVLLRPRRDLPTPKIGGSEPAYLGK